LILEGFNGTMAAIIRMAIRSTFLGLLFVAFTCGPMFAANERPELSVAFNNTIAKVSREASIDAEAPLRFATLVQSEYGTRAEELSWAVEQSLSWGEIVTLAYIQATTGRSFSDMTQQNARQNFWIYAEDAGMSCEKMTRSIEGLFKRAEKERNSEIFNRLRTSRHVYALPDLGSGFGLFQEALDFRRIDPPRPTKVHDGAGIVAKGDK